MFQVCESVDGPRGALEAGKIPMHGDNPPIGCGGSFHVEDLDPAILSVSHYKPHTSNDMQAAKDHGKDHKGVQECH